MGLDWNEFLRDKAEKKIYSYKKQEEQTGGVLLISNQFYGIKNNALRLYQGQRQESKEGDTNEVMLKNLPIAENEETGNSGLFSEIGDEKNNPNQTLTVQNLIFDGATVQTSGVSNNAAILLGEVKNDAQFLAEQIQVKDSYVQVSAKGNAGGIVGKIADNGTVTGTDISIINSNVQLDGSGSVGAFVGKSGNNAVLMAENVAGVNTTVLADNQGVADGLIGKSENNENQGSELTITDCFVAVPVAVQHNWGGIAGGLIGQNQAKQLIHFILLWTPDPKLRQRSM